MRARASVSTAVLLLVFVLCSNRGKSADTVLKGIGEGQSQTGSPTLAIYGSDPDHIWNRLFRLFYVRHARDGQQYGGDELDPYLWWQTRYLLNGSSHDEALKLLDEFLGQHSERAVTDPLRRAFFQRDFLAIYDWLSLPRDEQTEDRSDLQKLVTEIIRRLLSVKMKFESCPTTTIMQFGRICFRQPTILPIPNTRSFPLTFSIPRDCGYVLAKHTDALLPLIT